MKLRKISRNTRHILAFILLNIIFKSIWVIPHILISWAGNILGIFIHLLPTPYKNIILYNLRIAFPKSPSNYLKYLVKKNIQHMCKGALEVLWIIRLNPNAQRKLYQIKGKQNLENVLKLHKGAIIVSAHLGNFPFLGRIFSLEGYKTFYILRKMRDEKFNQIFKYFCYRQEIIPIYTEPIGQCIKKSIEALRKGDVLILHTDQDVYTENKIFVNFFNIPTPTPPGVIMLAQKTGASIIPTFIVREGLKHKVIIEPPIEVPEVISKNIAKEVLSTLNRKLEGYIRKYPEQWGWLNRRWMKERIL